MKKATFSPSQTPRNAATRSINTDRTTSIGLSKVPTSQNVKQYPQQDDRENSVYQDFGNLFGDRNKLTAPYSGLWYDQWNTTENRLVWKAGNGCHILSVVKSRNIKVSPYTGAEWQRIGGEPPKPVVKTPHSNRAGRYLSAQSVRAICHTFGLLYRYTLKRGRPCCFVTLTLPAAQAHRDQTIKKHLINHFNTWLKTKGVNLYMWVQENHENGSAHFHYIIDQSIHWRTLRTQWINTVDKLGYIERYQQTWSGKNFAQYVAARAQEYPIWCGLIERRKETLKRLRASYDYGEKTKWRDPNCTDIHKVQNVKRAGRYMAKYVSKINMSEATQDKDGFYSLKNRRIGGRKWSRPEKIKAALSKSYVVLDDQSFAIAMQAVDYLEGNDKAVVCRHDYRVHIFGEDDQFLSVFSNLVPIEAALMAELDP